jgi:hypothetical protein
MQTNDRVSPLRWNAGAWFGALVGSSLWLLVLGVGLLPEDLAASVTAFAGFAACVLWSVALWRRRERLAVYAGFQAMMLGLLVVFAVVLVVGKARVPDVPLPWWAIAVPLPVMAMFWWRQRAERARTSA